GPRADALEPPLAAAGVPPPTSTAPPYTTLFRAKPEGTPGAGPEREGATPRYTNDTNGAFESVATDDPEHGRVLRQQIGAGMAGSDRKSTRLNSSHVKISYAVFCLKKKTADSYG